MIRLPSALAGPALRWLKRLETGEHQLLYLFLEITRRCNLRCRHCGSDCTANDPAAHLTTETWLYLINFIAESFSPPPFMVLSGGEPLLHPDLDILLAAIAQRGTAWGLVSNGYSLDERALHRLVAKQIRSITVSLDGLKDSHNWLRNSGESFDRANNAIRLVMQSAIPFKDVVTCVNPRNLAELDSLAELLVSLNVPAWRLFRIFPAGRAKNNTELLMDISQTRRMVEWVHANRGNYLKRGLKVNLSCEGWLPYSLERTVRDIPTFCRAGVNIASILCDGTITGCTNNAPHFFEGNVLKDNFAQVWENGFGKFRRREWVNSTTCAGCKHLKDCRGGSIHLWQSSMEKPDFCYSDK
jgi:radical SAM protein with 4Fe4S-binding SPASM domain